MAKNIFFFLFFTNFAYHLHGSQVAVQKQPKKINAALNWQLEEAVRKNDAAVVAELFAGKEIPEVSFDDGTSLPLFLEAVTRGYTAIVKVFLDNGVDVNRVVTFQYYTALMLVVRKDIYIDSDTEKALREVFNLLLEHPDTDINRGNDRHTGHKNTPLSIALRDKCFYSVKKLICKGASLNFFGDKAYYLDKAMVSHPAIAVWVLWGATDFYYYQGTSSPYAHECSWEDFVIHTYKKNPYIFSRLAKELAWLRKKVLRELSISYIMPLAEIIADYAIPTIPDQDKEMLAGIAEMFDFS